MVGMLRLRDRADILVVHREGHRYSNEPGSLGPGISLESPKENSAPLQITPVTTISNNDAALKAIQAALGASALLL